MTASQWRAKVVTSDLYGSMWRDVIEDLAAAEERAEMAEHLAIGGDGSTHWYWKDEAERLAKELANERKGRE